jgi:hypothetical protein
MLLLCMAFGRLGEQERIADGCLQVCQGGDASLNLADDMRDRHDLACVDMGRPDLGQHDAEDAVLIPDRDCAAEWYERGSVVDRHGHHFFVLLRLIHVGFPLVVGEGARATAGRLSPAKGSRVRWGDSGFAPGSLRGPQGRTADEAGTG